MQTFKVLAALLVYPQPHVMEHLDEMRAIIRREGLLPPDERDGVLEFMDALEEADLLELQATYIGLFDQSRSLSLNLFEHIHGESRDRGQAMVDLLQHYHAAGMEMAVAELPDFLPLFLEFLSLRPLAEASGLLAEPIDIIGLLRARLEKRGSAYAVVFRAIEALASSRYDAGLLRDMVAEEAPDDTPEALDRAWEEVPVDFAGAADPMASPGCPAGTAAGARRSM